MNRKSYCSVLLQGIVDADGRFINFFTGVPDRVHDAKLPRTSSFFEEWQKMGEYRLLGDSAYIEATAAAAASDLSRLRSTGLRENHIPSQPLVP
ncbi:unnamed protein product [Boreogadus saida]